MQAGRKKQNIYFDTDAKRASTVFHKLILSFCSLFKPAQWFSVPGPCIIRLPLSAETQELDHKRQFHDQYGNFIQEYTRRYKCGCGGGGGWRVRRGRWGEAMWGDMSHFTPKTQEIKAENSESVRRRRVSLRNTVNWTLSSARLWCRRQRLPMKVQGHRVHHCKRGCGGGVAGVAHSREKNGTILVCNEGDKRGNGWRKQQTGARKCL